jgi:hypothetical protein
MTVFFDSASGSAQVCWRRSGGNSGEAQDRWLADGKARPLPANACGYGAAGLKAIRFLDQLADELGAGEPTTLIGAEDVWRAMFRERFLHPRDPKLRQKYIALRSGGAHCHSLISTKWPAIAAAAAIAGETR